MERGRRGHAEVSEHMFRSVPAVVAAVLAVALCLTRGSASPIPTAPIQAPQSPVPAGTSHLPELSVVKLYAGDEAGYPRRAFYTVERAVYFYATVRPRLANRDPIATDGSPSPAPGVGVQRQLPKPQSFWLSVRDPLGHEVARSGGALSASLDWSRVDLPRDCEGSPTNGLLIGDSALAERPGRYQVQAFLNGRPAGVFYFTLIRLRRNGEVKITSAAVEDAHGTRRFTLTSRDRGAYAHVTMVNASRGQMHQHLVQVAFVGPTGQAGRLLGGVVTLHKETLLDGRDFPVICDPEHHDGILIQGTPIARQLGPWKMVVYLDGRVAREVSFRIVP